MWLLLSFIYPVLISCAKDFFSELPSTIFSYGGWHHTMDKHFCKSCFKASFIFTLMSLEAGLLTYLRTVSGNWTLAIGHLAQVRPHQEMIRSFNENWCALFAIQCYCCAVLVYIFHLLKFVCQTKEPMHFKTGGFKGRVINGCIDSC